MLVLLLPALLPASQRVIVIEDFTATWCQYCPGAARGIDELDFTAFDSVVPIAYHPSNSGDPYYTAVSATRSAYYSVSGYPTARLDGNDSVVGGVHSGTMYPTYRQLFDAHKTVPSPLAIDVACTYDSATRACHLNAVIRNTTGAGVSGQYYVVIIENHIHYSWQGMDSLQYVVRDMLPNGSGEAVTIPANDSLVKTRDLTLNASWVAKNCNIVVFVQNSSTKQMYQGARTSVVAEPEVAYYGYQRCWPAPDSSTDLTIGIRNMGLVEATGLSGVLSTSDPYVTVTQPNAAFGPIGVGGAGYSTTPFSISVSAGCPDPHVATCSLQVSNGDAVIGTVTLPLNITRGSGASDNMENGAGGWRHSGISDAWHLSTYRSQSPSHSWYCGSDATHGYAVETDMRLVSPYFTVGDSAMLSFYHWCITEATYDFAYVELNNGSPFWRPIASFDGSHGSWQQETYDLAGLAGQTARIGFRFVSDGSVTYEGWYVDDFAVTPYVTAVAERGAVPGWRVHTAANPVRDRARIAYNVPAGRTGGIGVYDVAGHAVTRLAEQLTGSGVVVWDLANAEGRRVPAGTYFVRLAGAVAKVVVTR